MSFLEKMNINQMVIDYEIQTISEQLFEEWMNANLDEGTLYADYQFASMCESKEIKKAFNEFCDIIGCEPSELTKKVARGGGFYIALKYVCAYFIHVRGGNDGNIGRLLRKERTTILHGRNEVAYLIKSNNFSGRLYYKFLIEKAFSKTNIIDKGIPQHAFDAIL